MPTMYDPITEAACTVLRMRIKAPIAALEAAVVREAWRIARGNQSHGAELAGMSRNGFRARLKELGLIRGVVRGARRR